MKMITVAIIIVTVSTVTATSQTMRSYDGPICPDSYRVITKPTPACGATTIAGGLLSLAAFASCIKQHRMVAVRRPNTFSAVSIRPNQVDSPIAHTERDGPWLRRLMAGMGIKHRSHLLWPSLLLFFAARLAPHACWFQFRLVSRPGCSPRFPGWFSV